MQQLIFVILVSFAVTRNHANAQELDLASCLKMADTANLSLKNSSLDIGINEEQRKVYLTGRYPKLIYSGDYKYNAIIPGQVVPAAFFGGTPGTFSTVQFGVPFNLSNTLQLNQILYNPQLNYGLTALRINDEIVRIQDQMATLDVKQQVAATFFNLQGLYKQVSFIDSNILNLDGLIANMQALVKQQIMIQNEVDKLVLSKLTLQETRNTLTTNILQLEDYLKLLIGLPFDAEIQLVQDAIVEKTILVDTSEIYYPEMALLEAQQRMNVEERKGTKMSYLPNLSFYAAYNYNYNMKPADDFRVGIEGAFLGLRLDWTLFDGLEKHYQLKVNALNAEKIQNQKDYVSQQLELRTRNAKRQIELNTNALNLSKEKLALAQSIYNLTALKLKQGLIGSNDLILANNGLQEAQANLVSSYLLLRQAELEYIRSIGELK
jgi:outer membrane protein TolC